MLTFIINWIILSLAFAGVSYLMPSITVRDTKSTLIVSAIYAVLSAIVGKILFLLFGIGTLGLAWLLGFITWWIIGALMLLLTDKLTSRFSVKNFKTALIGSALITLLNALGHWVVGLMS